MRNKKIFYLIIEYAWLVMSLFCIVMGFIYINSRGGNLAWIIFLLAIISFGMFFVRRLQRKNFEKRNRKYDNE